MAEQTNPKSLCFPTLSALEKAAVSLTLAKTKSFVHFFLSIFVVLCFSFNQQFFRMVS
jgi:hypothetical protein